MRTLKILSGSIAACALAFSAAALADSSSFLTRLHSFAGPSTGANADGNGDGQLIVHSNGNVYGIRRTGGENSGGTFFRLTPAGAFTVLQHFGTSLASGQKQAQYPKVIIEDAAGDIYIGLEFGGYVAGEEGAGLVKYSPSTGTLTSLPPTPDNISLGSITGLVDGGDGYLYGTADFGIAPPPNNTRNASGAIFKVLKSTGAQTGLRFFDPQLNGEEGTDPGSIVSGGDGYFYGHNVLGGGAVLPDTYREASGTLWRINASGSTFQTLHLFKKTEQDTNGETPIALTRGADGDLYGQTQTGGGDLEPASNSSGNGVLFRYDIAGATLTPIRNRYNRDGAGGGGQFTGHPLIESGEHLYTIEQGSVYRVGKDGVRDSLHVFQSDDGGNFLDDLARGADGTFYVLAGSYGANNNGTISKLTLDPDPALLALAADPVTVPNGGSTTLTWTGSGAACRSYGGGPYDGQYSEAWNNVSRAASGCARIVIDNFFGGPLKLNFSMVCEANGGHVTVSESVEMLAEEGTPTSPACPGGGDPDPDPGSGEPVALTKGSPRAISGATDSMQEFYIDVPAGATGFGVATDGSNGDIDLYVRFAERATLDDYNCIDADADSDEACTFPTPAAGRYYILVHGYAAYSGASIVANYTAPSGGGDTGGGDDEGGGGGGGGGAMTLGLLLLALVRKWTR